MLNQAIETIDAAASSASTIDVRSSNPRSGTAAGTDAGACLAFGSRDLGTLPYLAALNLETAVAIIGIDPRTSVGGLARAAMRRRDPFGYRPA